jgi:sporulation protein YlmC with PRC-barrel domain
MRFPEPTDPDVREPADDVDLASTLTPEYPHDVGLEDETPDVSHLEGAHLLANDARALLRADGFTDDEILVWAETYLAEHGTAELQGFLEWMATAEHAPAPRRIEEDRTPRLGRLRIGEVVTRPGGVAGTVTRLVLSPDLGRLTHVVVTPHRVGGDARLVPAADLQPGDGRHRLRAPDAWTGYELAQRVTLPEDDDLDPFLTYAWSSYDDGLAPYTPDAFRPVTLLRDVTPDGGRSLTGHMHVRADDGRLGTVDGVIADVETGRIQALLVRTGHLLIRHEFAVPQYRMSRVDDADVHLEGSRTSVRRDAHAA